MDKPNSHEAAIRSVVGFAREVRIHMRDSRVIFGTVIATSKPPPQSFAIRPWGLTDVATIPYEAALRAVPVKQMVWQKQRLIAAAQFAGNFTGTARSPKNADDPAPSQALAPSSVVPEVLPIS